MSALCKTQRRFVSSKTTNTAKLECERKFMPTDALRIKLKSTSPWISTPKVIIHDKYFDYQDLMTKQGIYVRLRSEYTPSNSNSKTQWEAKIRLGGDYPNSQFEEVMGASEVVKAIQQHHSDFSVEILRKLPVKADMTTHRETWVAPQDQEAHAGAEMQVVIDTCHFNHYPSFLKKGLDSIHVVGELELTKTISLRGDATSDEAQKKLETADMSSSLERYVEARPELFSFQPQPIGKLTAYFAWKIKIDEKEKALKEASGAELAVFSDVE
jgi:hypothetical protein